jgi:enolase
MTAIREIKPREIVNSRGELTIEIDVFTDHGHGRAAAPGGKSRGKFEAKVLPINEAIKKARELAPRFIGLDASDQEQIDTLLRELDGTEDFSSIGGNVAIAISMATAKSAASSLGIPLYKYLASLCRVPPRLPYPLGNMIGGGVHADAMEIQEFLCIPTGACSVKDAVFATARVHKSVKEILNEKKIPCGKGDEGAWAPSISNEGALEVMHETVGDVSDEFGFKMRIGIDVAATELCDGEFYRYKGKRRSREEQILYIEELIDEYDLYYVEDPLEENDYEGFAELTRDVKCLICGDDLFVTNPGRIEEGAMHYSSGNTVLIKPNQIGTLTETKKAIDCALAHDYKCVISHRSGETTDDTIAHLAVGWNIPIIKTGVVGGERTAKLNELIRVEEGIKNPVMADV